MNTQPILILDDDEIASELFSLFMEEQDFKVDKVETIAELKTTFSEKSYAAIIIDWNLTDGNGLDAANYIRSVSQAQPILFMSGQFTDEMEEKAKALSPVACLNKGAGDAHYQHIAELISP